MAEDKKPEEKKEDEIVGAHVVFGISEEKSEEIVRQTEHHKLDAKDTTELAELMGIKGSGEEGYKAFVFGKLTEINDSSHRKRMKLEKMFCSDK